MSDLYVKACVKNYEDMQVKIRADKGALEQTIRSNLATLVSIYETNNQLIQKYDDLTSLPPGTPPGFAICWDRGVGKFRPTEVIHFDLRPLGNVGLSKYEVGKSQHVFKTLIQQQMTALSSVEEDKLYPLLFVHKVDLNHKPNYIAICQTGMHDQCDQCGLVITAGGMHSHAGSLTCMQASLERDVRENGWYRVDTSPYMAAIKRSGIPFEVRPSHLNMWVPQWVGEAIEAYKKKEKDGGASWAGLELHEYLAKVKPQS